MHTHLLPNSNGVLLCVDLPAVNKVPNQLTLKRKNILLETDPTMWALKRDWGFQWETFEVWKEFWVKESLCCWFWRWKGLSGFLEMKVASIWEPGRKWGPKGDNHNEQNWAIRLKLNWKLQMRRGSWHLDFSLWDLGSGHTLISASESRDPVIPCPDFWPTVCELISSYDVKAQNLSRFLIQQYKSNIQVGPTLNAVLL